MECDVAVLGGGPGGYTAAIRAAQLGAKTVCIEQEPELGGTCLRVGLHPDEGVGADRARAPPGGGDVRASSACASAQPRARLRRRRTSGRTRVVKQMTGGVACLFKANGVEWVKGKGRFKDANTIAVEGGEDVTFKQRDRRDRLVPAAPADRGARLAALRRLDRPARADGGAAAARRPRRRHHRLRVRVDLPALRLRGDDHRDARHADPAGGRGRGEGAREAVRQARDRAPARQAVHEGRGRRLAAHRPLRRGRDRPGRPDARLRRARRRSSRGSGSRRSASSSTGARASRPTSTAARPSRTSTPSATAPATGSSRTRRSARARSRPRTPAATRRRSASPAVPRPIYTDPEIAGVGLTEAQARERHGDDVAVGVFPWVANARAVMQNETVGWVKSIHETKYGELLGLVMVGPHVTDLIEAGHRRDRRGVDRRDRRRRHGRAPDALRGDQGGRARRARPRDPPAEQKEGAREARSLRASRNFLRRGCILVAEDVPRPARGHAPCVSPRAAPLPQRGRLTFLSLQDRNPREQSIARDP